MTTGNDHTPAPSSLRPADTSDISEFITGTAPDLLSYFARRITPVDDAADALGECLMIIWQRYTALPADLDGRRAWAFGIAHNVLRNTLRGQGRRFALAEKLRQQIVADVTVHHDRSHAELIDAVKSLRPDDRELVLLVAWEELTLAEAADVLGITPATARKRMSRLRQKLITTLRFDVDR